MDFLSSLAKGGDSKTPPPAEEKKPAASSDLLTSAKEAGAAAQAGVVSAPAKAAGAAADLLDAGSEYAKLDETKGVGKYVNQTETYLRDYSKQQPSTTTAGSEGGGAGDYIKKAQDYLSKPAEGGEKKEKESGSGDLLKAAGGFFSK